MRQYMDKVNGRLLVQYRTDTVRQTETVEI